MSESVRHTLNNLLGAYGYNLYADKNRMRADDLLVRERASAALGEAAQTLRKLQQEYRRTFIPPLTRDQPSPPRERMDALAEMQRLVQRLDAIEVRVRSMAVPPQDRVWERFRREEDLLDRLLRYDEDLITPCEEIRGSVLSLRADTWNTESATMLESAATSIEEVTRARGDLLQMPG